MSIASFATKATSIVLNGLKYDFETDVKHQGCQGCVGSCGKKLEIMQFAEVHHQSTGENIGSLCNFKHRLMFDKRMPSKSRIILIQDRSRCEITKHDKILQISFDDIVCYKEIFKTTKALNLAIISFLSTLCTEYGYSVWEKTSSNVNLLLSQTKPPKGCITWDDYKTYVHLLRQQKIESKQKVLDECTPDTIAEKRKEFILKHNMQAVLDNYNGDVEHLWHDFFSHIELEDLLCS